MSIPTGNFIEIVMCWSEWLRVKNKLQAECSSMSPLKTDCDNGYEARAEIQMPHWSCIKNNLDAELVKYQYIDRSVSDARWVGDSGNCK